MSCKWIDICPLRRFEKEGKLNNEWKDKYCKSEDNWKNCVRYQMDKQGTIHSDNILPDGTVDKNLDD